MLVVDREIAAVASWLETTSFRGVGREVRRGGTGAEMVDGLDCGRAVRRGAERCRARNQWPDSDRWITIQCQSHYPPTPPPGGE